MLFFPDREAIVLSERSYLFGRNCIFSLFEWLTRFIGNPDLHNRIWSIGWESELLIRLCNLKTSLKAGFLLMIVNLV